MQKISNPEQFRENVRNKMSPILKCNDHNIVLNLEKGIFNYAIKEATQRKIVKKWENPRFVQLYIDRLRSIYLNLNSQIIEQIASGEIPPQNVAFMTHQEFKPEQWSKLIERKMKRDASKYDDNIQASTDMYTCKKCRSKRCTYYEMQTRSADEPSTIFVTCLDCGKHWRS
jgi:DNA-directed RNA polymerase subunit M/transcription elongation factor TFIIS